MEDGGGQHRIGLALHEPLAEVLQRAGAAGSDHRHMHTRHRSGQLQIVPVLRPVTIHARQQYFPGAQPHRLLSPLHRITPGGPAPAVREHAPASRPGLRVPAGIDRHHDALTAEALGGFPDQRRPRQRRRVERHLVGARSQQCPHVVDAPQAAAHGQRHVDALGRARHHVQHDPAILVGGGDVQEDQLVGALGIVGQGRLDRVAGVAQVHEADALDHAAVLDVQAGNDTLGQHQAPTAATA